MGFKNYIPETYASIDDITYIKENKLLRFHLFLYKDESKSTQLASRDFRIHCVYNSRWVEGSLSEPPAAPVEGEYWLVKNPATGSWAGYDNTVTCFEGGEWRFWYWGNNEVFYYKPLHTYCIMEESEIKPAPVSLMCDIKLWENWFSTKAITANGSNLHRQIYLFLKQFPEFRNVTDS
jgi:hypothetical protein